ncbi:MAG: hypothetical protein KatS3mg022_2864 [Armatimonadota bacterium]|nr:MAG: hypothetical protein KatS3mg022_2864 [Armatimonadota bacterium]
MDTFDIAPFALPNCEPGEYRFEEPRDIRQVRLRFRGGIPSSLNVYYLRKTWPDMRIEYARDLDNPCSFGWTPIDDQFNTRWQKASIEIHPESANVALVTFKGLSAEFPDLKDYDVTFRRTLGVRVEVPNAKQILAVNIFTTSTPLLSRLRVEIDAGRETTGKRIRLSAYNATIRAVLSPKGVRSSRRMVELLPEKERSFDLYVAHMLPAHRYCGDEGHIIFSLDDDVFTISLQSLREQGPIWYAEKGVYITFADDPTRFADYLQRIEGAKTLNQRVREHREQTYAGAFYGQPRPHAVSYNLGCKHNRQRFWLEANGDLVLHRWNVTSIPGQDTARFLCDGNARFFFGLEHKTILARYTDAPPVLAYYIRARDGDIVIEQESFAVPLERSILDEPLASDDTVVALVRFRFENLGDAPAIAELPLSYSHRSGRSYNAYASDGYQDDYLVPRGERDTLLVEGNHILSEWNGKRVFRARWEGDMPVEAGDRQVVFRRTLQPGEVCELLLKIPYIAIDQPEELQALQSLSFEQCYREVVAFWRAQAQQGAQLVCPEPHLTALHAAHLNHVLITDALMPDGSGLINTSVGTSTYGNFTNEACMVTHELDQRGLHEEARKRIELWVKYQGTAPQPGNFTDYEGMYFGAGGFESGAYNQHHGWVLWCIGMHYFLTGDAEWLSRVAPSLIAGCDWVFRQRRNTMHNLPHSRGWEYGFLPAGSLEDVTDFHYWLSTNALTWRGVDTAAKALEAIGHPEAARIRREADAYRADLIRGFETMRQHSPLVRLRDGRWVPHYPSRLYQRGRDVGWIREVLEGSVYLLISGLYDADSVQAQWILDDFQDNRYPTPPYGYRIPDFEANWFDRAGFSIQPNLLAGLMPHLERDEPEIFIWMFFNAWCACYREEINAMIEHPMPVLGYSNSAHFKTSDEANAVSWLRAMFVYASEKVLHLGRAIPREWFHSGKPIATTGVCTRYGTVSVSYHVSGDGKRIKAAVDLQLRTQPPKLLVRFRHPESLPIRAVRVNSSPHNRFDPQRNDVDITGYLGKVVIETAF